jgi:hypothetical protein
MKRDLTPHDVERRLERLAKLYVPETLEESRARVRADGAAPDAFASAVARRLDELRALDELARYLHQPRKR